MTEKTIKLNGIDLCYEHFPHPSNPNAPAVLLVMGLSMQMIAWPDDLIHDLIARGHQVIRFDNRDSGKTTHWPSTSTPNIGIEMVRHWLGLSVRAPYTLWDIADDAVALLTHLGIARAHVAGVSMGGMIAQCMAIRHPERVMSLISIMSASGQRRHSFGKPRVMRAIFYPPPRGGDRAAAIRYGQFIFDLIGSQGALKADDSELQALFGAQFDRGYDASSAARQLAAIGATGDRTPQLSTLKTPTLVIHGRADPLIRWQAGAQVAACVPGARIVLMNGMGHDWPRALRPWLASEIAQQVALSETQREAQSVTLSAALSAALSLPAQISEQGQPASAPATLPAQAA